MPKPHFFYCTGTSYVIAFFNGGVGYSVFSTPAPSKVVSGLNGVKVLWPKGGIQNDPFPKLLDAKLWASRRTISYTAAMWPMVSSIQNGVQNVVKSIAALDAGTPFCLGGYSQGAAVMSLVLKNHLRQYSPGSGLPNITSRLNDLKGAVMFGNPSREANKSWPGNLTSATVDAGYSGGHGAFPEEYRLTNTPSYWWEFIGGTTSAVDIVASVGDGPLGTKFTAAAAALAGTFGAGSLFDSSLFDAVKSIIDTFGDAGHIAYPFYPPPGYPAGSQTSYQRALTYLNGIADGLDEAPAIIPSFGRGSTVQPKNRPPGFLSVPTGLTQPVAKKPPTNTRQSISSTPPNPSVSG